MNFKENQNKFSKSIHNTHDEKTIAIKEKIIKELNNVAKIIKIKPNFKNQHPESSGIKPYRHYDVYAI